MKRLHLIELEDQPWFPGTLRDAATAYLEAAVKVTGHAELLAGHLAEHFDEDPLEIIDLCSGSGGAIPWIVESLRSKGRAARATLTDLYPNQTAAAAMGGAEDLSYHRDPVDATAVPEELRGLRTLLNGFHHFRPEAARRILADAQGRGQPIAIYELVGRDLLSIFGMFFIPLFVLLLMPRVRGLRLSWLFWTYVIPLVPFLALFDGLVSCLRVYSVEELEALIEELPKAEGYEWLPGALTMSRGPGKVRYLLGRPFSS